MVLLRFMFCASYSQKWLIEAEAEAILLHALAFFLLRYQTSLHPVILHLTV